MEVFLALVGGLLLLVGGGTLLVRSAGRMAQAWGVSPLVVGLTVVAFGTSAPELAVSVKAAWAGESDVALGNIIGSNTFNVLFILGLSALITPLRVAQRFVRREVPLLIVATGVSWVLAADGRFGAIEGTAFLALLIAYTILAIRSGVREEAAVLDEYARSLGAAQGGWVPQAGAAIAALGLLVLGADLFVDGASGLARALDVSERIIAVLVVAPGTSLPEVATSVTAALKGERDIAVANVVGSCLFNLLGVLGATAAFGGGFDVPAAALRIDLPIMTAAAIACVPIFASSHRVSRAEGALLLGAYAAYVAWLLLGSSPSTG